MYLRGALETAVILGSSEAFAGFQECDDVFHVKGQQFYGLRPWDLRGVVDESTCLEIQRFLYRREQSLASALPIWINTYDRDDVSVYTQRVTATQERLADSDYDPLKFCPFDDDECWDELIRASEVRASGS